MSFSIDISDIRSGLYLLKESALAAENKASRKVTPDHVKEAIAKLDDFSIKNTDDLEPDSRFILDLIKRNSGKKIGDLQASVLPGVGLSYHGVSAGGAASITRVS